MEKFKQRVRVVDNEDVWLLVRISLICMTEMFAMYNELA